MNNNEPTPRPWRVDSRMGSMSYIRAASGELIASCSWKNGQQDVPATINARHIVKCVNLHGYLIAALRTVVETEYDRDEESRNFDNERLEYFASLIAKAEGRAS